MPEVAVLKKRGIFFFLIFLTLSFECGKQPTLDIVKLQECQVHPLRPSASQLLHKYKTSHYIVRCWAVLTEVQNSAG